MPSLFPFSLSAASTSALYAKAVLPSSLMSLPPPPLPPVNMRRVNCRGLCLKEQHIHNLLQECEARVASSESRALSLLALASEKVSTANERAGRAENKCAELRVALENETRWKRDTHPLVAGLRHVTSHTHKCCFQKTRGKACIDAIVDGAFDHTGREVVWSLAKTSHGNLARFDVERMLNFQSSPFCKQQKLSEP